MNRGSFTIRFSSTRIGSGFNEAPIHESGKSRDAEDFRHGRLASMRPRFMNRGSSGQPLRLPKSRSSFNEAPIHESGKSVRTARIRRRRTGFNEAPIHESGKFALNDHD